MEIREREREGVGKSFFKFWGINTRNNNIFFAYLSRWEKRKEKKEKIPCTNKRILFIKNAGGRSTFETV